MGAGSPQAGAARVTGEKHVPSSAGGGPRDFSEAVHANVTQSPAPAGGVHLEVHVHLGESEKDKIAPADLFEAIADLLARHGVDPARSFHEAFARPE